MTEQPTHADRQTRQAVADLMERLSVPASDVRVVTAEEVTWRDGSLGCPKKDRMYTMALVEGRRIVLEVDGKQYAYHAGGDKPPFYCEHPKPPAPGGAT